ncbi:MAG: helix-turn-helix transcriptional regulator [Clostridia bacterium]|nr:helix-turn-helix transcriptional regulator [Clostridia bacterium]
MSNLKIGEKIKAKRREREFTQEELAAILGVSKAAVSKWENGESYPDMEMLPQIAQLFHMSMDELFEYTLEYKPIEIVTEYCFGFSLDNINRRILDHCIVKKCEVCNCGHYAEDKFENLWEVRVQVISREEDFPYIIQKYIHPGVVMDGVSVRIADGKAIIDNKPNKHFVCREKVWNYNIKDQKYIRTMINEQLDMGLIGKEDAF